MGSCILPVQHFTVKVAEGKSVNAIKFDGFDSIFKNSKNSPPVLLEDVQITENDVTLPVVALDDKRVLYSFGQNFGQAAVRGTIYLHGCSSITQKMKQLKSAFDSKRVAKAKKPVNLSAYNVSVKVYPIAITFSNADPVKMSIGFTIEGIIAPVSNK